MMSSKNINTLSWVGVIYGFLSILVGITDTSDANAGALIIMGLVFAMAGGLGIYIIRKKKNIMVENELNRIFYDLIKKKKGKITVVDFAAASNLSATQARAFVEAKAIQFSSMPDIEDDGTVVYYFK